MSALHVLMLQMKLLRVYCSYSHLYIILLEVGTEIIHASYVKHFYHPKLKKWYYNH